MNGRLLGVLAIVVTLALVVAWQLGLLTPEPDEVNLADAVAAVSEEEGEGTQADTDSALEGSTTVQTAQQTDSSTDATSSEEDQADGGDVSDDSAESEDGDKSDDSGVAPCTYQAPDPVADGAAQAIDDVEALEGRWSVRESESTFAGYRIDEILSGADFTAVGRASGVSGAVIVENATITTADIAVDLVGLTSDSRIRDEQLKRQALQTSRFPTACFSLTDPITIDALPSDGTPLSVEATGSLHIHGVDQTITMSLDSTVSDGLLVVVGSTEVALADFEIEKPQAPSVADVSDTAVMEFSLVLSR